MTTTAHEGQFTAALEPVRQPYSTEAILRRNIADLEVALRTQTERAEKAETELAKLAQQNPAAWMHDKDGRVDTCHDSVKRLWIKVGQKQNTPFMRELVPCRVEHYNIPLYAAPVPAPAVAADQFRDATKLVEWRDVMKGLADDAEQSLLIQYSDKERYPSLMLKFNNDMAIVNRARALLQSAEGCSSQTQNEVRHD